MRSVNGERLVEETEVSGLQTKGEEIRADIELKDLIEADTEYMVIFQIRLEDGREASYYTRVIQSEEEYHLEEKLDFAAWFSETALNGDDLTELKTYLESNREGDNTTLSKVNIHSSLTQVGWADLDVEQITEPVYNIKDITEETASITVEYLVE